MPRVQATAIAPVPPATAFAVSQTTGELRLRWDPFIRSQHFLDGATAPDVGVRTLTVSRHHLRMVSRYVSYNPPTNVGMVMDEGPPFFANFAGGWRFAARDDGTTEATWSYSFTVQPSWLARVADPVGRWLLGGDIQRRLDAFVRACEDPAIVAAATT